jgi:[NiFe] hydrogenase diaphorase moiety small subunit
MSSLFIDGVEIPCEAGQTIMDAALAAGHYIPHLCHNPEFRPHGSCRLCLVKVNGRNAAACITPAVAGAEVENNSEELMAQQGRFRKLHDMQFRP